jgi:NADH-quinone oxidoreductase subunit N
MDLAIPRVEWAPLAPMLPVAVGGLAVLVGDLWCPPSRRRLLGLASLAAVSLSVLVSVVLWGRVAFSVNDAVVLDRLALFFNLVFGLVALASILLAMSAMGTGTPDQGEYYSLLLFSALGMMVMASGGDLVMIFLGLETLSLALYTLSGFRRADPRSNEAALKYLLLGAFASGFLLYGIALVYGATGTTVLRRIAGFLADGRPPGTLLLLGGGLLLVGFAFKVASVPFHMWTPDVYEGAPTPVTAFMIAGTKAAAFAPFLRVFLVAVPALHERWAPAMWVLAALTMTVGNLVAMVQPTIKRMLAYSSIAHAGYLLVAMVAGGSSGAAGVLFYLVVYALMNLGAFAVMIALQESGRERLLLNDYAGLGARHPVLAACMALSMFSLAGLPPTAGFMGKLYIFSAALDGNYPGRAVLGVLNSVVSVSFYLRLIVIMYMQEPAPDRPAGSPARLASWVAALSAVGTLHLGLFPAGLIELAAQSLVGLGR